MTNSVTFTQLTEPQTYASPTSSLPAQFDTNMAYFLGQCCALSYLDYDNPGGDSPMNPAALAAYLTALSGGNNTITFTPIAVFTRSVSIGPQGSTSTPGDFATVPAGFALSVSQSNPPGKTPAKFNVLVMRGTATYAEWIDDAEMFPAQFSPGGNVAGSVEAGFLAAYCTGTNGAVSDNPLTPGQQASGSLTAQVQAAIETFSKNNDGGSSVPLYITGHSLGGALAPLCALDVALNYGAAHPDVASEISMYSLAAPRTAIGVDGTGIGTLVAAYYCAEQFVSQYQAAVPNSFRIVHAADLVPILPAASITINAEMTLVGYHVTDNWSYAGKTGGLPGNVVNFCAQTGSISGNHSCVDTYVPYLAQLASSFDSLQRSRAAL